MNSNRLLHLALAAALLAPAALHAQFSQPVRDVENPAQNVFVANGNMSITGTFDVETVTLQGPINKRWTIESVGFDCRVPASSSISTAWISVRTRNSAAEQAKAMQFPIQMTRQGNIAHQTSNTFRWTGLFSGRIYHDQIGTSTSVMIGIGRKPPTEDVNCSYSISGGSTNLPMQ
jgi:hypothetical protein